MVFSKDEILSLWIITPCIRLAFPQDALEVTEHRNLIIRRNVTLTELSASQMAAHEPGLAWEDVFLLL